MYECICDIRMLIVWQNRLQIIQYYDMWIHDKSIWIFLLRRPSILSPLTFLLVPHMTITLIQYYFTLLYIFCPPSLLPNLPPSLLSFLPPLPVLPTHPTYLPIYLPPSVLPSFPIQHVTIYLLLYYSTVIRVIPLQRFYSCPWLVEGINSAYTVSASAIQ